MGERFIDGKIEKRCIDKDYRVERLVRRNIVGVLESYTGRNLPVNLTLGLVGTSVPNVAG